MVGGSIRSFSAAKAEHVEQPGKASGRKTANPGWYNKRFEPSQGNDGNYFDNNSTFRGDSGFEPR